MNKNVNNVRAMFFQLMEDVMQANTPEEMEKVKEKAEIMVHLNEGGLMRTCKEETDFIKAQGTQGSGFLSSGNLTEEFFKGSEKKLPIGHNIKAIGDKKEIKAS